MSKGNNGLHPAMHKPIRAASDPGRVLLALEVPDCDCPLRKLPVVEDVKRDAMGYPALDGKGHARKVKLSEEACLSGLMPEERFLVEVFGRMHNGILHADDGTPIDGIPCPHVQDAGDGFPSGEPFKIAVGREKMRVTASHGTTWSVARSHRGTPRGIHHEGDEVVLLGVEDGPVARLARPVGLNDVVIHVVDSSGFPVGLSLEEWGEMLVLHDQDSGGYDGYSERPPGPRSMVASRHARVAIYSERVDKGWAIFNPKDIELCSDEADDVVILAIKGKKQGEVAEASQERRSRFQLEVDIDDEELDEVEAGKSRAIGMTPSQRNDALISEVRAIVARQAPDIMARDDARHERLLAACLLMRANDDDADRVTPCHHADGAADQRRGRTPP